MKINFNQTEMDLTTGNLFKKIILFALPIMITSMMQLLYTSIDLIVVSKFGGGASSMSAVGANGSLINLIINLFMGFSVGANVVMAHAKGNNNILKGRKTLHTSLLLSLILGIVVGAIGAICARFFLEWMQTPSAYIDQAETYLRIYFIGLPFLIIYNFGASLQRAMGDSTKSFISLTIAGVINVLFNLLFVIVFKWDVAGVAFSTVISEGVAAGLTLLFLYKNKGFANFRFKELKLDKECCIEIAKIGFPAGLQNFIFSISNVFIQTQANAYGEIAIAGNTASNNIEGYIYAVLNSFSVAGTAFAAQNYGARNKENIKKVFKYGIICSIGSTVIVGGIITLLGRNLLPIFTGDLPEAIESGYQRLMLMALTYFTCGVMDYCAGFLRGIKYSLTPTIITFVGACLFRIIFIYTIYQIPEVHTIQFLYASYPMSWTLTCILYIIAVPILLPKGFKKIDKKITEEKLKEFELKINIKELSEKEKM